MKRLAGGPNPGMAVDEQTDRPGNIRYIRIVRQRPCRLNFGMADFPAEVRGSCHNAER